MIVKVMLILAFIVLFLRTLELIFLIEDVKEYLTTEGEEE